MQFRLGMDDVLSEVDTSQLGRFLIAIQFLEEMISSSFSQVIGMADPFGITDRFTREWTSGRRAKEAVRVIDVVRDRFQLPPAEASWKFTLIFGASEVAQDTLAAAEALITAREFWKSAKCHMDYRNQLFHGRLYEKEGTLSIRTKGSELPFDTQDLEARRNHVISVAAGLAMASSSVAAAVRWLSQVQRVKYAPCAIKHGMP